MFRRDFATAIIAKGNMTLNSILLKAIALNMTAEDQFRPKMTGFRYTVHLFKQKAMVPNMNSEK